MAGGKAARAVLSAAATVQRAFAALARRIAGEPEVRWLRVAVRYAWPVEDTGIDAEMPVCLVPSHELAEPGTVTDDALMAELARSLDSWLATNAPAPGDFVFTFQWGHTPERVGGDFTYP